MNAKRLALVVVVVASVACLSGCTAKPPPTVAAVLPDDKSSFADMAMARGRMFLISTVGPGGAWRSTTYSSFQDGASLTPLVVLALQELHDRGGAGSAIARGTEYLVSMVKPNGTIDFDEHRLSYPVYTAALAVRVLSQPGGEPHRAARDAWLAELRRRQLDETLGWSP